MRCEPGTARAGPRLAPVSVARQRGRFRRASAPKSGNAVGDAGRDAPADDVLDGRGGIPGTFIMSIQLALLLSGIETERGDGRHDHPQPFLLGILELFRVAAAKMFPSLCWLDGALALQKATDSACWQALLQDS
jgi:hypothetical protein